jgi:hypothetical protein
MRRHFHSGKLLANEASHCGGRMLQTIEDLYIGILIRESLSVFGYSLVLSLHAIGLAIVLGINTLLALRLLGVGSGIPLTSLRDFYGVMRAGFAINVISGVLLFIASATTMGTMVLFWIKMALVASGMVIALTIKARFLNDTAALANGVVPAGARQLAYLSLFTWYLALIAGRLTGYPEILAHWLGM